MATPKRTTFETLNEINVNEKTEKKGNLTYLSWAWAWAEVKKLHPNVTRTVYENEHGFNYFTDGKTAWVKIGVTIDNLEHIDYLPIMDFRNKSITVDNVTSFDVNKAIQRSTTKALALHGLGLYIYAGEDLPEGYEAPQPKKPTLDTKRLNGALNSIKEGNYTEQKLYDTFELTDAQRKKVQKFMLELEENHNQVEETKKKALAPQH
tara:strand:+ start:284 stop:904 length:621 start_codon:yes stop_codon:yes gene_type:complete